MSDCRSTLTWKTWSMPASSACLMPWKSMMARETCNSSLTRSSVFAILDNLRELDWGPRHLRKQARRIEEARLALAARSGRVPSEEELAFEVGLSLNKFQLLVGELRGLDLLSIQVDNPDDTYQEDLDLNLADTNCEDPFDLCSKSEIRRLVRNALLELPRREGQILVLYYFEELTMKQIGA